MVRRCSHHVPREYGSCDSCAVGWAQKELTVVLRNVDMARIYLNLTGQITLTNGEGLNSVQKYRNLQDNDILVGSHHENKICEQ